MKIKTRLATFKISHYLDEKVTQAAVLLGTSKSNLYRRGVEEYIDRHLHSDSIVLEQRYKADMIELAREYLELLKQEYENTEKLLKQEDEDEDVRR